MGTDVEKQAPDAGISPALPTEEQVSEVVDCVCNHPRHRELLYKALLFCRGGVDEPDAVAYVEAQPEYAEALQESGVLLHLLVRHGGLARADVASPGPGASGQEGGEPAEDDHVPSWRLTTTPAGESTCTLLSPSRRIGACIREVPERENAFLTVLELCREPRKLSEIKAALADDPALAPSERTAGQRLLPSYFIDRLSAAGALVWDGAWVTTQAGLDFLAAC